MNGISLGEHDILNFVYFWIWLQSYPFDCISPYSRPRFLSLLRIYADISQKSSMHTTMNHIVYKVDAIYYIAIIMFYLP